MCVCISDQHPQCWFLVETFFLSGVSRRGRSRGERRRKPRCFISTRFLLFLPSGFWILLGRRMSAVLPRLRHGNRRRQDWLGGMRWGGFEFSRSCICLGLFLGMGWGRQGGETRPFCGFSFLPSSYPSMTDTDFSRLNFSYELLKLVGLFFLWGFRCGLGYFSQPNHALPSFFGAVQM